MTPAEYVTDAIAQVLPTYKTLHEFGFSFDDFVAKYAAQMPVAYVSYSGFSLQEKREYGADAAELFSVYLRDTTAERLYEATTKLRQYVARNASFIDDAYNEITNTTERVQYFVDVVAGTPTLFTKGFDSFELTFSFTN